MAATAEWDGVRVWIEYEGHAVPLYYEPDGNDSPTSPHGRERWFAVVEKRNIHIHVQVPTNLSVQEDTAVECRLSFDGRLVFMWQVSIEDFMNKPSFRIDRVYQPIGATSADERELVFEPYHGSPNTADCHSIDPIQHRSQPIRISARQQFGSIRLEMRRIAIATNRIRGKFRTSSMEMAKYWAQDKAKLAQNKRFRLHARSKGNKSYIGYRQLPITMAEPSSTFEFYYRDTDQIGHHLKIDESLRPKRANLSEINAWTSDRGIAKAIQDEPRTPRDQEQETEDSDPTTAGHESNVKPKLRPCLAIPSKRASTGKNIGIDTKRTQIPKQVSFESDRASPLNADQNVAKAAQPVKEESPDSTSSTEQSKEPDEHDQMNKTQENQSNNDRKRQHDEQSAPTTTVRTEAARPLRVQTAHASDPHATNSPVSQSLGGGSPAVGTPRTTATKLLNRQLTAVRRDLKETELRREEHKLEEELRKVRSSADVATSEPGQERTNELKSQLILVKIDLDEIELQRREADLSIELARTSGTLFDEAANVEARLAQVRRDRAEIQLHRRKDEIDAEISDIEDADEEQMNGDANGTEEPVPKRVKM